MQDRFKFRGYNKNLKKWFYGAYITQAEYADSPFERPESKPAPINHFIVFEEIVDWGLPTKLKLALVDKDSLGQCTGLKDQNGKLIYEGDIIVIHNLYPFYDYANKQDMTQNLNETEGIIKGKSVLNYIGIVEWIYSSWQYTYHCVNPKKNGISEGMNNLLNEIGYEDGQKTEFEVIGNIYENKEWLKEKK